MSQLDPYLFFDGTCAEAMRFYEKALGGKLEMMMTQAEAPPSAGVPPGSPDRIMHASLALGDRRLMASDTMAGRASTRGMHGFSISLSYPSVDEAKKVFDALAAGGKSDDADGPDLLGRVLRHARRPLRHVVDGQRRQAGADGLTRGRELEPAASPARPAACRSSASSSSGSTGLTRCSSKPAASARLRSSCVP